MGWHYGFDVVEVFNTPFRYGIDRTKGSVGVYYCSIGVEISDDIGDRFNMLGFEELLIRIITEQVVLLKFTHLHGVLDDFTITLQTRSVM